MIQYNRINVLRAQLFVNYYCDYTLSFFICETDDFFDEAYHFGFGNEAFVVILMLLKTGFKIV